MLFLRVRTIIVFIFRAQRCFRHVIPWHNGLFIFIRSQFTFPWEWHNLMGNAIMWVAFFTLGVDPLWTTTACWRHCSHWLLILIMIRSELSNGCHSWFRVNMGIAFAYLIDSWQKSCFRLLTLANRLTRHHVLSSLDRIIHATLAHCISRVILLDTGFATDCRMICSNSVVIADLPR